MTKAVIFDLDNCLAAADEVGRQLFAPAFDAIRAANRGELPDAALEAAFDDCWRLPLDAVAEKHGFSKAMLDAGWRAFEHIEVREPMHGYGDLEALGELPALRFLVTSGFRRLQQSKIAALRCEPLFTGIYVDAIDESGRKGKQAIFREILRDHRLSPDEVIVVGDNPDAELKAGSELGMRSVQILRPGVARGKADRHIRGLADLKALV